LSVLDSGELVSLFTLLDGIFVKSNDLTKFYFLASQVLSTTKWVLSNPI